MPTSPTNRMRRVTDKQQGVSFDSAALAIRQERQEADHRILQSEVKGSIQNMSSTLDAVQVEVRKVVERVTDVQALRAASEQDRAGMNRIESALRDLDKKLDTRFERMERENEDRWLRHEAENENQIRELQTQIDTTDRAVDQVERKISRAVGWVSGISVTAALLVGGALWGVNFRFEDVRDDLKKIDQHTDKIHAVELYLARGGQTPARPYAPPQEKTDEQ